MHVYMYRSYEYSKKKKKRYCAFTRMPMLVVSTAAVAKLGGTSKTTGCCVKDGYTFVKPRNIRKWAREFESMSIVWNSKSNASDLAVPITFKKVLA